GKGRWIDNARIERFWRTVKQEQIYLNPLRKFEKTTKNTSATRSKKFDQNPAKPAFTE
ncbi:MAG: transposase InsO family protein, partial [Rickettsiales bacterium]